MEGVTYLVAIRHGKPVSDGFADETLRPLSEEGRQAQLAVAKELERKGMQPDRIFSSPILRASQTAEVMGGYFDADVEIEPSLGYEFDSQVLLKRLSGGGVIYFVGHAPHLAEFVNRVVGEVVLPQGLSKGMAAIVRFDAPPEMGRGRLLGVCV